MPRAWRDLLGEMLPDEPKFVDGYADEELGTGSGTAGDSDASNVCKRRTTLLSAQ